MGKITKTEKYLLLLTAIFLLCLALLYFTDHRSAGGGDYTVTPQYTAQEPEAPDPPAVPGKVNINTADAAQLEALDGIGPTLAQRIVAYREEHGPFADIESIMDVNGIGEGIFETIRQQITVETIHENTGSRRRKALGQGHQIQSGERGLSGPHRL